MEHRPFILAAIIFSIICGSNGECDYQEPTFEILLGVWRRGLSTWGLNMDASGNWAVINNGQVHSTYTCERYDAINPIIYLLRKEMQTGFVSKLDCVQVVPTQGQVLLLRSLAISDVSQPALQQCEALQRASTPLFVIYIRDTTTGQHQGNMEVGTYTSVFSPRHDEATYCGDMPTTTTVTSSMIVLDSCYAGQITATTPFRGVFEYVGSVYESSVYPDSSPSAEKIGFYVFKVNTLSNPIAVYPLRYKLVLETNTLEYFIYIDNHPDVFYMDVGVVDSRNENFGNYVKITLIGNACDSNPCQNGGPCLSGFGSYICDCSAIGFEGDRCEISTSCQFLCQNGGMCILESAMPRCDCSNAVGYMGDYCEINVDDCAVGPCQNGGTCTDAINDFSCACPGPFYGKSCQNDGSACQNSPCSNGGICNTVGFTYTCSCPSTHTGVNCETPIVGTLCHSINCLASVTCFNGFDNSAQVCDCSQPVDTQCPSINSPVPCPPDYHGTLCDVYCMGSDSCAGHYICDQSSGAKVCYSGWGGADCASRSGSQPSPSGCTDVGCRDCYNGVCCCFQGQSCP